MNVACTLGLHTWEGCKCSTCAKTRDREHNWTYDCEKCERCGAPHPEGHDWSANCQECKRCGKAREKGHNWRANCEKCAKCGATRPQAHKWHGCKCTVCRKTRDEGHDWTHNCEQCHKCGAKRQNIHHWDACLCVTCGQTREVEHDFVGLKCRKCGGPLRKLSLSSPQTCLILNYRDEGIRDLSYLRMAAKLGPLIGHMERRDSHYDYFIVIGNCTKQFRVDAFENAGCAGFTETKTIAYAAVLADSEASK